MLFTVFFILGTFQGEKKVFVVLISFFLSKPMQSPYKISHLFCLSLHLIPHKSN